MYREFVLAWIDAYKKGAGIPGVANKCNLTIKSVSAKAHALRKKGVELPATVNHSANAINVDMLNQLIHSKIQS